MSLERYMDLALQHPDFGYYRRGDPIGTTQDFSTAPEISQMFGECIGLWALDAWQKIGKPNPFVLLELGPGHGTMLKDLLRFTEPMTDFHDALRLHLFESNATLRDMQQSALAPYAPVHLDALDRLPALPILVLANEFFDNLPLRQFVKTDDGWRETLVAPRRGSLKLVLSQDRLALPPDPYAGESMNEKPVGWVHEMSASSRALLKTLAAHAARNMGAGLVIDYGYAVPPGIGTLDAWSESRPTNILARPGQTDVTADVDFGALSATAKEQGVFIVGPMGQGDFLLNCGIKARAEFLKNAAPDETTRKKIDDSLAELIAPSKMGALWKAFAFSTAQSRFY